MRTNGLRRWLLRGAIITAISSVGAAAGQAGAHAEDIIWHNIKPAAADEAPADDQELRIESDITWH